MLHVGVKIWCIQTSFKHKNICTCFKAKKSLLAFIGMLKVQGPTKAAPPTKPLAAPPSSQPSASVPFYCKVTHSKGLVYTQVALTVAFAITGIVLMAMKRWDYAYIFISSAAFSGISANTTLQVWLNTDACHDKKTQALYAVCSLFTLLSLLSWAILSLDLLKIVKLRNTAKSTKV